MRPKIAICAEYQGIGAAIGTTTGFQLAVEHLLEEAGRDGSADVIVFCLGTETKTYPHPRHPNVIFRQYRPLASPQEMGAYVSSKALPFRVELIPLRRVIIRDLVREKPDVIHTFQTFGATDIAGFIAAKKLRRSGHTVRLISSVTTEIETYISNFFAAYIAEILEFAETHSYLQEVLTAWRLDGVERPRSWRFRAFNALVHTIGHPICRSSTAWHRLRGRTLKTAAGETVIQNGTGFQKLLWKIFHTQIGWYLRRVDAVTTSRPEDAARYRVPTERVWHLPLTCNADLFQVSEESLESVRARCDADLQQQTLSPGAHVELLKFLEWTKADPNAFICVSVGRLSDEKNVWLLQRAFRRLLEASLDRPVYWLALGSGIRDEELAREFQGRIALPGLIPNDLLPPIFNLVREHRGTFVSASDSETYGIAHEEAQRCGLPIVAMELGTRGHFYASGDRVGDEIVSSLPSLHSAVQANGILTPSFALAANGFGVPDFSAGKGLSVARHRRHGSDVAERSELALFEALLAMARLPIAEWRQLSESASKLTAQTKMGWKNVWQLLCEGVYPASREGHAAVFDKHRHIFQPFQRPAAPIVTEHDDDDVASSDRAELVLQNSDSNRLDFGLVPIATD